LSAVAERVNAYLTACGRPVCDRCVKEVLDLPHLTQVQQVTGALGTTRDFERGKGVCSRCLKGKLVTARKAE
jgi:hypothetical protein